MTLRGITGEVHAAGLAAALSSAVAVAIGALAARFEARLPGVDREPRRGNRVVAWGLAALAVAGAIGFVAAVGDPVRWVSDRADEFRYSGSPDLSQQSSRFVLNFGSDRYDAWRVALDDALEDPLLGEGGGGYQYSYLRERESRYQNLRDAHSVELELLSELGFVGFGLFAVAIVAMVLGVLRARRLGSVGRRRSAAIALAAPATGSCTPPSTGSGPTRRSPRPIIALLGCACGAAVLARGRRGRASAGALRA